MLLKDLLKTYTGKIALFNYYDKPIYNDFEKVYNIDYLSEKEVIKILVANDTLKIKLLV